MGQVVVRPATHADAGEVAALTLAAYEPFGWGQGDAYWDTLADGAGRIAAGTVLVAELEGRLVGAVTVATSDQPLFEHDPRHGDGGFRMLAVHPSARRHGIGRTLTEASLAWLRTRGVRRVLITTMEFMSEAQRMYAGLGFVRRPDLDVRYPRGRGLALAMDLVDDAAAHFPPPGPVPEEAPWYADVIDDPSTSCA